MDESYRQYFEIFTASGCIWIVLYFIANWSVKKFIVIRYTQETNLSETFFFSNHAPFVKYLPAHLSAGFYATHLVAFAWAWKFVHFIKEKRPNVTYFNDIPNREYVIKHFNKKEIAKAKCVIISGTFFFIHILTCLLLDKIISN